MFTICSFNSPDLDGYQGTTKLRRENNSCCVDQFSCFSRGVDGGVASAKLGLLRSGFEISEKREMGKKQSATPSTQRKRRAGDGVSEGGSGGEDRAGKRAAVDVIQKLPGG
jgi:hypothetical protein